MMHAWHTEQRRGVDVPFGQMRLWPRFSLQSLNGFPCHIEHLPKSSYLGPLRMVKISGKGT